MSYVSRISALLAGLLLAHLTPAQNLTNAGTTVALTGGATLFVPGTLTNTAAGSVLDLSNGANTLVVGGNFVNGGPTTLVAGATSTVLLSGSAAQTLDLNGATLANLTASTASGEVGVPSSGTITGALALTSGLVRTAPAATLTLANGASLVGEQAGRFVAGNLAALKTTVSGPTAFPNGISLTPAAPLSNLALTRTAGLNTAQLSYGTNASGSNKGIDQVWQVSAALTGTQLTLTWFPDNDNGLTAGLATSQLWARAATPVASSDWSPVGGLQNAAGRSLTAAVPGSQSFSFFTVSTAAAPLPVTLVAFTAERQGDAALLRWQTASELNNSHFDIEVSPDGQAFANIGRVAGQGTSATAHRYAFADARLLAYAVSPVYYRLRQVDRDGTATYSPVRAVRVDGALSFALSAFPNPLGPGGTRLRVRTAVAGLLTLAAYDAAGRLVLSQRADLPPGTTELDLPAAGGLATGVYYLSVSQAGQHAGLKLVHE